jgi:CBS domain-containing protein
VHIALLVEDGLLVGAVERADLAAAAGDGAPARDCGAVDGRTVGPDDRLSAALARMRRTGRRRLAVTSDGAHLVGLLCLKASGRGFCSDEDVAARSRGVGTCVAGGRRPPG